MARGINAPSPSIFSSDPLEQIAMRDMFAPGNKGGLAFMMLNGLGMERERRQEDYLSGLQQSNKMAALVAKMEEEFKMRQVAAKLAADLLPHGVGPSATHGGSDVFSDLAAGDSAAALYRAKTQASINKDNAAAASSGSSGTPKTRVQETIFPTGASAATVTTTGTDPLQTMLVQKRVAEQIGEKVRAGRPLNEMEKDYVKQLSTQQRPGID